MSESILVEIDKESFRVNPGEGAEAQITIRNSSRAVDVFTIDVEGIDKAWWDLTTNSVSLFPGDSATSDFALSVPKDNSIIAEQKPFTLKVSSRKDPGEFTTVPLSLEILPFHSLSAEFAPHNRTGTFGSYSLTLTNQGNTSIDLELRATDTEEACKFIFDPPSLTLSPGQESQATLHVEPKQRPLKGTPAVHSFTVRVVPKEEDLQPFESYGVLEVPPKLPRWAVTAATLVGILAIGVILAGIAALIILQPWATKWDVDETIAVLKQSPAPGQAFVEPREITPSKDADEAVINVTWKRASVDPNTATINVILQNPEGKCQDADQASKGQPLAFGLNTDDEEWINGCPQMEGNEKHLVKNKWALYLKNETNQQLSDARLQVRYQ